MDYCQSKWAIFDQNCNFRFKNSEKLILNFRQNEFTVMSGRKKAVRRIFLFENLILFTKPKRTTQGGDVYQYKNSWLVSFKINFKKTKFPEKKISFYLTFF